MSHASTSTPMLKKPQKHSVHGKMLSLEEVEVLAKQEDSQAQVEENLKRKAYSNELIRAVLFDGCKVLFAKPGDHSVRAESSFRFFYFKEYLMKIIDGSTKCTRNDLYLSADARERRRMRFTVGPLLDDDQIELAKYTRAICNDYYKDKPKHLVNYEFDVLYVEAVIWAIMRTDNISYKKAEMKYKHGFKQTHEELVKSKCNDILQRLSAKCSNDSSLNSTDGNHKPEPNPFDCEDNSYFAYLTQTDESKNDVSQHENKTI